MVDEIRRSRSAEQVDIVDGIEREFGSDFVFVNDKGNRAISRPVLREFRRLHAGSVGWERERRAWYVRAESDSDTPPASESSN